MRAKNPVAERFSSEGISKLLRSSTTASRVNPDGSFPILFKLEANSYLDAMTPRQQIPCY